MRKKLQAMNKYDKMRALINEGFGGDVAMAELPGEVNPALFGFTFEEETPPEPEEIIEDDEPGPLKVARKRVSSFIKGVRAKIQPSISPAIPDVIQTPTQRFQPDIAPAESTGIAMEPNIAQATSTDVDISQLPKEEAIRAFANMPDWIPKEQIITKKGKTEEISQSQYARLPDWIPPGKVRLEMKAAPGISMPDRTGMPDWMPRGSVMGGGRTIGISQNEPGFVDKVKYRHQRGEESAKIDQQAFLAASGINQYEDVKKMQDDNEEYGKWRKAEGNNWFSETFYKAVEMLPPMESGIAEGMALGIGAAMLTGASTAGIGAVPAYATAQTFGSMAYWWRQGTGMMYMEMRRNGVDHNIAGPVAMTSGLAYAAIEYSQIGKIIPGFKKELTNELPKLIGASFAKHLTRVAGTVAFESGEESAQQLTQVVAEDISAWLQNKFREGEVDRHTTKEAIKETTQAFTESLGPMAFLVGPRSASGYIAATIEPTEPPPPPPSVAEEPALEPVPAPTPAPKYTPEEIEIGKVEIPPVTPPIVEPTPTAPKVEKVAPEPPSEAERGEKEPWEITQGDYIKQSYDLYGKGTKEADDAVMKFHKQHVGVALSEGKPVPPEVLVDYPDLKPEVKPAPVKPPVTEKAEVKPEVPAEKIGGYTLKQTSKNTVNIVDTKGKTIKRGFPVSEARKYIEEKSRKESTVIDRVKVRGRQYSVTRNALGELERQSVSTDKKGKPVDILPYSQKEYDTYLKRKGGSQKAHAKRFKDTILIKPEQMTDPLAAVRKAGNYGGELGYFEGVVVGKNKLSAKPFAEMHRDNVPKLMKLENELNALKGKTGKRYADSRTDITAEIKKLKSGISDIDSRDKVVEDWNHNHMDNPVSGWDDLLEMAQNDYMAIRKSGKPAEELEAERAETGGYTKEEVRSREGDDLLRDLESSIRTEFEINVPDNSFNIVEPENDVEKAAQKIAKIFRQSVVFVEPQNSDVDVFNGINLKDKIVLNKNSSNLPIAVVGHEITHRLRKESPKLYDKLVEVISEDARAVEAYKSERPDLYPETPLKDYEYITEEFIGDTVGERMSEPEFWENLNRKSPSLVEKIKVLITRILKRLQIEKDFKTSQYFKDIQKVRDTIDSVMAEYAVGGPDILAAEGRVAAQRKPLYQKKIIEADLTTALLNGMDSRTGEAYKSGDKVWVLPDGGIVKDSTYQGMTSRPEQMMLLETGKEVKGKVFESLAKESRKYRNAEEFAEYLIPKLKQYTKVVGGYANEGIELFYEDRFFDRLSREFKLTRDEVKKNFPIQRREPMFGEKEGKYKAKGLMEIPDRQQLIEFYNKVIPKPSAFEETPISVKEESQTDILDELEGQLNLFQKKRQRLELSQETKLQWLQRQIQDKLNRLEFYQKKIPNLSEETDAYLKAELFIGRASDRIEKLEKVIVEGKDAFLERLSATGYNVEEFGEYLYARHAKERNAHIQKINPKFAQTKLFKDSGGSGLTDEKANIILEDYKDSGLDKFADEFYEKVTKSALNIRYKAGMIDKELYDIISKKYENYVPLKGKADEDTYRSAGKGFSVKHKGVMRAKGRVSLADNPFVQAIMDYEDAVISAEKNKVGQTLLKLIQEHPSDVWSYEKQQYIPNYDNKGEIQFFNPKQKDADNIISVWVDGKKSLITINDKALAAGIKNLGTERGIKYIASINAYLRSVNTIINPEFIITNFERDLQTAQIHLAGEHSVKIAAKVTKDIPKALKGIWRNIRDKESNEWSRYYTEMKEIGGKVGWFDQKTLKEKQKVFENKVKFYQKKSDPRRFLHETFNFIYDINEAVESGVRLSAYKNLIDAGISKEKAAQAAKNLTVNFNKKGNIGSLINSLWLFSNAGIQGTARIFTAMGIPFAPKTRGQKRVQGIVAGMIAASFMQSMMNRYIDEDDYEQMSDWNKDNYWLFMIPNGRAVSIKVPYGYNIFHVLGNVAEEMTYGDLTTGEAMKRIFSAANDAFNPLGGGSLGQFISPTASDPFVQIAENKNFFGAPIKPEQPQWGPKKPESQLHFKSVRKPSKAFTDWLNKTTGGTEELSGKIDISPETIDHFVDWAGGGLGRFIANTLTTGESLLKEGDFPEMNNVPMIRQMIKTPHEWTDRGIIEDMIDNSKRKIYSPKQKERFDRILERAKKTGTYKYSEFTKKKAEFNRNQRELRLTLKK